MESMFGAVGALLEVKLNIVVGSMVLECEGFGAVYPSMQEAVVEYSIHDE